MNIKKSTNFNNSLKLHIIPLWSISLFWLIFIFGFFKKISYRVPKNLQEYIIRIFLKPTEAPSNDSAEESAKDDEDKKKLRKVFESWCEEHKKQVHFCYTILFKNFLIMGRLTTEIL